MSMLWAAQESGTGEMRRAVLAACVIAAITYTPAFAQKATLTQKFNDWSAYASKANPKVCFAVTQPKSQSPKNVKRGPIYFYVSRWPDDGVDGEISVKMGYPFKPGAKVTVTIGSDSFELFTKDEGAFVEKADVEKNLVAALKTGTTMKVDGVSSRGTKTSDSYSLSGVSDALDRMIKECSS